jgi:hypothetical protein
MLVLIYPDSHLEKYLLFILQVKSNELKLIEFFASPCLRRKKLIEQQLHALVSRI